MSTSTSTSTSPEKLSLTYEQYKELSKLAETSNNLEDLGKDLSPKARSEFWGIYYGKKMMEKKYS